MSTLDEVDPLEERLREVLRAKADSVTFDAATMTMSVGAVAAAAPSATAQTTSPMTPAGGSVGAHAAGGPVVGRLAALTTAGFALAASAIAAVVLLTGPDDPPPVAQPHPSTSATGLQPPAAGGATGRSTSSSTETSGPAVPLAPTTPGTTSVWQTLAGVGTAAPADLGVGDGVPDLRADGTHDVPTDSPEVPAPTTTAGSTGGVETPSSSPTSTATSTTSVSPPATMTATDNTTTSSSSSTSTSSPSTSTKSDGPNPNPFLAGVDVGRLHAGRQVDGSASTTCLAVGTPCREVLAEVRGLSSTTGLIARCVVVGREGEAQTSAAVSAARGTLRTGCHLPALPEGSWVAVTLVRDGGVLATSGPQAWWTSRN
ncbi:hypothetical protein [Janibacter sp. G56]|uniref:hypothetical protein n=1 Tax=Janibacter sp. G56 TaxID=3418717 RepID=UPI003CFFB5C2